MWPCASSLFAKFHQADNLPVKRLSCLGEMSQVSPLILLHNAYTLNLDLRNSLCYRPDCILKTFNRCADLSAANLPDSRVFVGNSGGDIGTDTRFEHPKDLDTCRRAAPVENRYTEPIAFRDRNLVHVEHGLHSRFYAATNKIGDRWRATDWESA